MKRIGIMIGTGISAAVVVNAVMNAFLPTYLAGRGLSNTLIGFILTWDNYLAFVTVGLIGWLSDRTWTRMGRRRPWLIGAVPLTVLLLLAVSQVPGTPALLAVLFLLNLCLAAIRVPTQALLADRVPPEQHTRIHGITSTVLSLAVVIIYVASGVAAERAGLFGALAVTAAAVVALALPPLFIREERAVAAHTASELHLAAPVWALLRQDASVRWSLLALFSVLAALGIVESWVPDLAQRSLGLTPEALANVLAAATLTLVVASIPAGMAAQRWGGRRVLRLGIAGLALVYTLSAVMVRDATSLAIFMGLIGLLSAIVYATGLPVLYQLVPTKARNSGAVTGLYFVIANGAYAVGPQVGGILIDATGSHTAVLALAAGCALASSLAWVAADAWRSRGQQRPAALGDPQG